jgi:hypothetical protein
MLSVSDCHVHPLQLPTPLFVVSPCLTSFPGNIFLAGDSSFGVFEEMVKSDCHKDCAPISLNDEASPINNDVPFLSLYDMITTYLE